MVALSGAVTFVVSLLVGGLAIFVGSRIVTGERSYGYAVWTALAGALVWWLSVTFLSGLPLVGSVLPLLAWVGVIRWRYDESWVNAAVIGVLAWVAAVLVLEALPVAGVVGVPFV